MSQVDRTPPPNSARGAEITRSGCGRRPVAQGEAELCGNGATGVELGCRFTVTQHRIAAQGLGRNSGIVQGTQQAGAAVIWRCRCTCVTAMADVTARQLMNVRSAHHGTSQKNDKRKPRSNSCPLRARGTAALSCVQIHWWRLRLKRLRSADTSPWLVRVYHCECRRINQGCGRRCAYKSAKLMS